MLLMGMWMSLTKKPMKPMMAKPMAVATAIFWNSAGGKVGTQDSRRFLESSSLTFPVRLGAPLDQPDGVLAELFEGLAELLDLVHLDGELVDVERRNRMSREKSPT